jgi:hypothetical protein
MYREPRHDRAAQVIFPLRATRSLPFDADASRKQTRAFYFLVDRLYTFGEYSHRQFWCFFQFKKSELVSIDTNARR